MSSIALISTFIPKVYATTTDDIIAGIDYILSIYYCEILDLINAQKYFYKEGCLLVLNSTGIHFFTTSNYPERYPFIIYTLLFFISLKILIFIFKYVFNIKRKKSK